MQQLKYIEDYSFFTEQQVFLLHVVIQWSRLIEALHFIISEVNLVIAFPAQERRMCTGSIFIHLKACPGMTYLTSLCISLKEN